MAAPSLKFRRVHVRRMPGVESAFDVDGLSPGINVVFGPNGCGKSRTAAAINALLWPAGHERLSLGGVATIDGDDWRVDLDAGAVRYQRDGAESGAPHLPPADARDRYNLPLHELLRDDRAEAFAQTILRESAGGYDLRSAAEAVGARAGASVPRKESDSLKAAARALKDAEGAQRALLDEERNLADFERSAAEARSAAGRAELLQVARRCRGLRESLAAAEVDFARFPAGVGLLRGDEPQTLRRLDDEPRDARATLERSTAERQASERVIAECDLGDGGSCDEVLRRLPPLLQRLAELRNTLDAQARLRDGAAAERDKARGAISPKVSDEQVARTKAGTMREVAEFARDLMKTSGDVTARDAMQAWLGAPGPAADAEKTSHGLRLLWQWLNAAPAAPAAGARRTWVDVVAAVVILAQAVVLAWTVHRAFAATALLPVLLLLRPRRAAPGKTADARAVTAEAFAKTGLPGPHEWTADRVATAADLLARQLAAERVDAEKSQRWEALSPRRKELDAHLKRLDVKRQFLAAHFGVGPDTDPLSLVTLASAVAAWQEADGRLARAAAEYDSALERFNDDLSAAAALLRPFGYEVGDVSSVAGAVDGLRDRQARRRAAEQSMEAAVDRAASAQRQIDGASQQIAATYERLGLDAGDEATLRRWCGQRADYEAARQEVERAALELQLAERALDAEPSLRDAAAEQVDAGLRDAAEAAARAAALHEQMVAIRTRVDAAKKGADVEAALSAHDAARAALAGRREGDCRAVAAWALVEQLRNETRDRHRPAVFHRARQVFSAVTQGRYRLDFDDSTDPPGFRAVDTSTGAGHGLDELSSGTRLQLLLSVRVAFVEEQEQGLKLPLLLDETLANSDETRARAIIDATVAIARSGRQVFYFTAQLDEVAKWRSILEESGDVPFRLVDLAAVRGMAATERLPLRDVEPLPQAEVPEPVGLSREQYAALLQVPRFDPTLQEIGGTHLWHLIDDPAVLHKFLKLRVNTWGQLRTLGEFNAATLVNGSRDALRKAAASARALEAMGDALRVGRGRPLDRRAVLDSGAVTDKFVEPVCELLGEVGHDAAKLVEALDEGRVLYFRKEAVARLRAYFCETGHLDERAPLSAEQVRVRVLAAVADDVRSGAFDPARVDAYLAACAR